MTDAEKIERLGRELDELDDFTDRLVQKVISLDTRLSALEKRDGFDANKTTYPSDYKDQEPPR